ncbi:hypothetical protein GQ457_06G004550 [Hibiscus cannabinus]
MIYVILNGGDPGNVALLPVPRVLQYSSDGTDSGIAAAGRSGGSLLTVTFQILVDSLSTTAKLCLGSVATVNNLIACTVERFKNFIFHENVHSLQRSVNKIF